MSCLLLDMKITLDIIGTENDFLEQVERESGEDLSRCYQCGNCSGSCPVSYAMDIPVTQVIRLVQLGQEQTVLRANSMWLCVSCLQCQARCPKCLDPSKVMEALRRMSLRQGRQPVAAAWVPMEFFARSPQQAVVAGFRKLIA
jgi:heterodisulfide reductase subunit C